jgi:hypothetical protein
VELGIARLRRNRKSRRSEPNLGEEAIVSIERDLALSRAFQLCSNLTNLCGIDFVLKRAKSIVALAARGCSGRRLEECGSIMRLPRAI